MMLATQPVLHVVSKRYMASVGLCGFAMWGQDMPYGERKYLLSAHVSRLLHWRAMTVIVGPLFLQFSWRARQWA
ncbi:MAG: hypothetical protein HY272_01840 [Gammaproteobacteria bacterium]|nr:hypothetical protein [Gammaproteobacteria bacterium]